MCYLLVLVVNREFDSYKEADMSGIINRKMATRGISALVRYEQVLIFFLFS